ncbi:restriction endonuclease subunit S [Marinomonas sp.]|uniref:restriction endonuclease subunit S n=1 Tax=Marinomonas sp. TaxID=1904862 RepID=UPI003BAA7641
MSYSLNSGDILISITAELGKIGWVPDNLGEAFINQHTALVRLKGKFTDSKFVAYLLSSKEMNHKINRLNDSGAKAGLNLSTIRAIPLLLPPLPEQRKIAEILSTWDKSIVTTEKLIAASQQQKKALMQQLLTGKKRFAGFSEKWEEVKLKQLGEVVSGGTPSTTNSDYWDGDVFWVTPTDITKLKSHYICSSIRKISKSGLLSCSAKLVPKGSLLVCTRATIGTLAITKTEMCTNQGFKNLVPNKSTDVEFLYYLLAHERHQLISKASGSTFLELSKKDFDNIRLKVPSFKEQQKIAAVLTAADQEIDALQSKLAHLQQEKKALMQQLLTGKRRVVLEAETSH